MKCPIEKDVCLPEIIPDLASGLVTIDDRTHTAKSLVYSGVGICSQYRCVALLDTGSPQTFILESAWQRMAFSGAADERFACHTTPRTWGGFCSQAPLSTSKCVRLSVQFLHGDAPSAALTLWAYVVPAGTMQYPVLLGRDSWTRFKQHSNRPLPRVLDTTPFFGELDLRTDDVGPAAFSRDRSPEDNAGFHLVSTGQEDAVISDDP